MSMQKEAHTVPVERATSSKKLLSFMQALLVVSLLCGGDHAKKFLAGPTEFSQCFLFLMPIVMVNCLFTFKKSENKKLATASAVRKKMFMALERANLEKSTTRNRKFGEFITFLQRYPWWYSVSFRNEMKRQVSKSLYCCSPIKQRNVASAFILQWKVNVLIIC